MNGEPQPVRWTPPEVLEILDRSSSSSATTSSSDSDSLSTSSEASGFVRAAEIPWTSQNGVWSLAVTLWEASHCGRARPFDSVPDASFVAFATGRAGELAARLGDVGVQVTEWDLFSLAGMSDFQSLLFFRAWRQRRSSQSSTYASRCSGCFLKRKVSPKVMSNCGCTRLTQPTGPTAPASSPT